MKSIGKYILLIAVMAGAWWLWQDKPQPPVKEYVKVPEIQEVKRYIKIKGPAEIQIIEKEVIKEIPVYIRDDVHKQVTATGVIAPYAGKTNVLAIMDTATGKSEIQARQLPLPFFEFRRDAEMGIRYGLTTKGQGMDIYGRVTLARAGRAYIGAYAELNNTPEAKAMVDISCRW